MPQNIPPAAAQQIDARRIRFTTEWREGRSPRIEDYLGPTRGEVRTALFRVLLGAEIEWRRGKGERLDPAAYRQRFPDEATIIAQMFGEPTPASQTRPDAPARDTAGAGATLDTVAPTAGVPTRTYREPAASTTGPQKIGRFELLALLGEGAFGKVYRARDPHLDREVALKVPQPGVLESQRDLERFLREAKAAATIQHPNICPVYEIGQEQGSHYIVMAYVRGQSLADQLRSRKTPMQPRQAALTVRKLALALQAAHDKGIVHRDLKPGNILIDNERKELVITDFGLARRARADEAELTQSGAIMGTPAYMAPEQARGDTKAIGPWSDVYSLGVILYEMLAGQRPFSGSIAEVMGKLLHVEPDPPSRYRPDLDPALEAICLRTMAKDPARRYRSMKELAGALGDWLKGMASPVASAPGGSGPADPAAVTAPADNDNRNVAELMRELSAERKAETEALVREVAARARVPFWAWLAGAGFMGVLVLLGIIFFARTPTATVLIQIDVDLKDKTLSFLLDGKPIDAAELEKPIELKVGEHELLVKRNEEVIRRYQFSVSKGAEPEIKLKEPTEPPRKMPREDPDYKPLFNGKDLTGWKTHPDQPGEWRVKDGYLTGSGPVSHLFSERGDYVDFHVRAEFRVNAGGNSGLFFRSEFGLNRVAARFPAGYEAQILHRDPLIKGNTTGTLVKFKPGIDTVIKPDEWVRMEVIAQGNHIVIKVNDTTTVDCVEEKNTYTRGHFALQLMDAGSVVQFRKIEVKELKPVVGDGYTPLFNGKDLTGWKTHPDEPGDWKVENGVLVGRGPKRNHLFTERDDFADFHFLVEARINAKGNSGQLLRCKFVSGIPQGYEAQIDSGSHANKTGTLYVLPGQTGHLVKEVLIPPDTWYTQEVIVRGNRFIIKLNDKVVTDFVDEKNSYSRGHLALQVWDPPTVVEFRRVWVKELKPDGGERPGGGERFVSLFNGKDLTGWEGQGDVWRIKDGAIFASTFPGGSAKNTFLCLKQSFKDFELEFDARLRGKNNTGVMIRSDLYDRDNYWLNGIKCDLGDRTGWGTLVTYDGKNGRVLKSAKGSEAQKAIKEDDFNRVLLRCVGQKVTVRVNGVLANEAELAELAERGVIAFQLRYGEPTEVSLKNIRIRELK